MIGRMWAMPSMSRVSLNMRQPAAVAALYFSQSDVKPTGRVWAPRIHTPPSISMAIRVSGCAKSNLHLRVGSNRYSRSRRGPFNASHVQPNRFSRADCIAGQDRTSGPPGRGS